MPRLLKRFIFYFTFALLIAIEAALVSVGYWIDLLMHWAQDE